MTEAVRWITGQCSDDAGPGGRVVATIHAPALAPMPPGGIAARVHCAFLFDNDKYIFGEDDAQCIELAIWLVCYLFEHRGVTDVTLSVVPPDETTR